MATKRPASKRSSAKKVPAKAKRRKTAPARKASARGKKAAKGGDRPRVVVENVNVPGYRTSVDAATYEAMRATLMSILPRGPPGLTQAAMMDATRAKAPRTHFPGGAKTEWWTKCVQLDQEAKGTLKRSATKPLRWWRTR